MDAYMPEYRHGDRESLSPEAAAGHWQARSRR